MIDEATIYVKSGKGGDGFVHFHREKFVSRGGPDGGDGGRGGSVILVGTRRVNTLYSFLHKKKFVAADGKNGSIVNRTGSSADNLRIDVPLGTLVRDAATNDLLADLTTEGQEIVVAKGGRGGRGNQHYATSTNQAPRMAERGVPGEERRIKLELRLIADVGIVGVPNAGKSTLLSVISNAKPKIAAYPFTTLEPQLGVVVVGDRDIVVADIPGLIEGAHMGIGLGHTFLRHIQRTRVLIHLLDGAGENPLADFNQINAELALFDEDLAKKPQIVALNKIDLPDAEAHWEAVERALTDKGYTVVKLSAATQSGTQDLMNRVAAILAALPDTLEALTEEVMPLYAYTEDEESAFTISRDANGAYHVRGKRIERAAAMTYWEFEETLNRFQKILEVLGITKALIAAGVQVGDTVFIGDYELEWTH
ncbi:MAG TPA: GTPase ObgE [Aggregatilineales bacterium]|nr:GTPase ObgE [Anaerolineales bacterium]HRE47619.1 GTPase ObgE [Aggregatilineales bacterium]